MTMLIASLGAVSIVLLVVSVVWFRRLTALLIPAIFAVLFWGTVHAVDYLGYAIDAEHLAGTEAVVLETIEGNEWVYLLVRTSTDKEPRLVRIASTDKNKEDAQAAMEQAQQGLTVIRFGATRRDGTPSGGTNGPENNGPAFEILNLEDTNAYGKATASSG